MKWGSARGFVSLFIAAALCVLQGCGSAGLDDGGGRGTGIGAFSLQGNIAASGPDLTGQPVCPALGEPARVSVRGTDIATAVAPDCTFVLTDVPAGDVTLDFTTADTDTSLTLNGVPPETLVVLTDVRLHQNTTDVAAVEVRPAESAPLRDFAIIADPPSGDAPLVVQFSFAPAPLNTTQVKWGFGDGSRGSSEFTPSHVYPAAGDFVVSLTVAEPMRAVQQVYLVVRATDPPAEIPLSVRLAARPQSGTPPLAVSFSASVFGSHPVRQFLWDFSDGSPQISTETGEITHTYERSGSFLPIVTVIDEADRQAGNSFPIVVERNAVAVRPTRTATPITAATRLGATSTATPTGTPTLRMETPTRNADVRPTSTTGRSPVALTATRVAATVRPTAVATGAVDATPPRTVGSPLPSATRDSDAPTIEPTIAPATAVFTRPLPTQTAPAEATLEPAPTATQAPEPMRRQPSATARATRVPPTATARPSTRAPTAVPTRAPTLRPPRR